MSEDIKVNVTAQKITRYEYPETDNININVVAKKLDGSMPDLTDDKDVNIDVKTKCLVDYNALINRPKINGVTLEGDLAIEDILTEDQGNAINSGITSDKVDEYDDHIKNTDIHVTLEDKEEWSGKQDKLTPGPGISIDDDNVISCTQSGGGEWGTITGNIEDQEDLMDYLISDNIGYENSEYPSMSSVQDALDKLLYSKPSVSITGGGTYEDGSSLALVNLSWSTNKKVTSQSLNQGIGSIPETLRSYTYSGPVTTNKTFTITVGDGTNTASSSTSVTFRNYYYYGTSSKDTLTDSDIRALRTSTSGGRDWATGYTLSKKTFDCSPTEASPDGFYIYYALPTSLVTKEPTFKVNGLNNTAYLKTVKSDYVNASGKEVSYTIYRFMADNKLTASYEVEAV